MRGPIESEGCWVCKWLCFLGSEGGRWLERLALAGESLTKCQNRGKPLRTSDIVANLIRT
jgi:hypothetical protein